MTSDVFDWHEGTTPLLISVPHGGRLIPDDIAAGMTDKGRALPDTDWHVAELYGFATEIGANIVAAKYSRYVVDLNRPPGDGALYANQVSTGLCPERTFAGDAIYAEGGVTEEEREARVARYWHPYHDAVAAKLGRLREEYGYALLWDAHSIASHVPALFEGELPALNLGTYGGRSCASGIEQALTRIVEGAPYSSVVNERFTGGYITRHFGAPSEGIHAVQLELAQRSYMDENTLRYDRGLSALLIPVLRELLQTYLECAANL